KGPRRGRRAACSRTRRVVSVHVGLPAQDLDRRHARHLSDGDRGRRPLRRRDRPLRTPRTLHRPLIASDSSTGGTMRPQRKFVWTFLAMLCTLVPAPAVAQAQASCDERAIDPTSYALTTRAQARIVTDERSDWWDGFDVGNAFDDLADLNASSTWAAERARSLDPHNLLAHGLLARQYVVTGQDAHDADAEWATVLDNGGAVVWTATLYDVDAKSYFLLAFDRRQLRIYRYGELAGAFETQLGMPKFVDE